MKKLLLPFFLIIVYTSCRSGSDNANADSAVIDSALAAKNRGGRELDSANAVLLGTFEGVIPCADCGGIKTELTLYQDAANSDNNSYTLKETYLGGKTGDTTFTSTGKWDILKGIKTDKEAVVYFLNYEEPDDSRYFLKQSDTAVLMLDKDQNIIASNLNYTLKRNP
ncbi:hypothetical protein DC498_01725 [Terrimonas sp.]|uniref:copper resistance protein NlpE n=1 Tax=Terrimonas sp. TaxID=1914338 RepID=UPI000D511F94|nr:copper resistance protein NlpE [Terrimonas sp.]PVD54134.1 hypothetical protein DC498_01725 [Terrimonas sp.]